MTFGFNAFVAPTLGLDINGNDALIFPVTGQPGVEFRVRITPGTTYDETTGIFTGGILGYEVFDTIGNTSLAYADLATDLPQTGAGNLADYVSVFLGGALSVVGDTFTAWNILNSPALLGALVAGIGESSYTGGTAVILDLTDGAVIYNAIGKLKITGTNISRDLPETAGTISRIELLDANGDPLAMPLFVDYAPPISLAELSYGLLSLGLPGGGNGELITAALTQRNDVINYGPVDYSYAAAGVEVHLEDGSPNASSATGVGANIGQDFFSGGGAVTHVTGSQFDDIISGNDTAFGQDALFGQGGDDTITAGDGEDVLDGGAGADTLSGGLGDDLFFGGADNDTIHGDSESGQLYKDVLLYSRISVPVNFNPTDTVDRGIGAELYSGGITVTYSSASAGTVASNVPGDNIGTDTFDGIEAVWGTKNDDTFNGFSGGGNFFVGMDGADTFNGAAASLADTVSYNADIFDYIYYPLANPALGQGVIVNLDSIANFGVAAGHARDSFNKTDTLNSIENVEGSFYGDVLIGSAGVNKLVGLEGDDLFFGGDGADVIWGGVEGDNFQSDFDSVIYGFEAGSQGIVATAVFNATNGNYITTVKDTFGKTDVLHGVAAVYGTDRADTFNGSTTVDFFYAGRGNDTITSGGSIAGIGGQDEVSYLNDTSIPDPTLGIIYNANLATGQIKTNDATNTYWGTDTLVGFTRIWLEGTVANDIMTGGALDDIFFASLGTDTINGGGGQNILNYGDFRTTGGVTFNATGFGTAATTAGGTVLESNDAGLIDNNADTTDTYLNFNAFGGSAFVDTFNGNGAAETFAGFAGNDVFNGGGGVDTADYRFDFFFGAPGGVGVVVNLSDIDFTLLPPTVFAGTALDSYGDTDTLNSVENVFGSFFNDILIGSAVANRLDGGDGNDVIFGGDGNDVLIGGLGGDFLTYIDTIGGVTVNLGLATAQVTGGAGTDTISGFEDLEGGAGGDTLTGTASNNFLRGREGNDRIFGLGGSDLIDGGTGDDLIVGGAGGDTMDGGTGGEVGGDTVSYAGSVGGVVVDLFATTGIGGDAQGDTLMGFENIIGTGVNDILRGDGGDNVIEGGTGNDQIDGNGGLNDTASYASTAAGVAVRLATIGAQNTGGAGIDTLIGIANLTGSAFNDTLTGDTGDNVLKGGLGNDTLSGGFGADTLDGGANVAGGDTASYASSVGGVTVDLRLATAQIGFVDEAGDILTGIENLTGGSGDDVLTGDGGANRIDGGAGDDIIDGLGGSDTLIGGLNTAVGDTLSYAGATGNVTLNLALATAQVTGVGTGTDTVSGFENLTGGLGNDTLTGSAGINTIDGGDGDDLIRGGAGGDILIGGLNSLTGGDTVSYAGSLAGVTVNLTVGTGQGGDAAGDQLTGFENIIGSGLNDQLVGDAGDNVIEGGAGNDFYDGGAGGSDTAAYVTAAAGVTVNLSNLAIQNTIGAGLDQLSNITNLTGSAFNDVLTGDGNANTIIGGLGNDMIQGGAAADTLDGGANVAGGDTASYASSVGGVTVDLRLSTAQIGTSDENGDLLIGIENLTGGAGDDVLTGDGGANRIDGGAGDDIIDGLGGNDILIGGTNTTGLPTSGDTLSYAGATGNVVLNLALATAQVTGGAGTDTISGFENLTGSAFNDVLTGTAGINVIDGGDGDDTIRGGAGADVLDGGANGFGGDTLSYAGSLTAVRVDLGSATQAHFINGLVLNGDANDDETTGFENIIGSGLNDFLTGDLLANVIIGGAGVDTINAGDGDDTVTGGTGGDVLDGDLGINDTVSYATSALGVRVDLTRLSTTAGALGAQVALNAALGVDDAVGDRLIGFENVTGSALADMLTGDAGDNIVIGGAGNDTIQGGAGADTLDGGAGTGDTVSYAASAVGVEVDLMRQNSLLAQFGLGDEDGDILTGFENLTGSSQGDTLIGNGGNNIINGGLGDDTIVGGGGVDTLMGGGVVGNFGNDTLSFAGTSGNVTLNLALATAQITGGAGTVTISGFESLTGGTGNDTLTGSAGVNTIDGGAGDDVVRGGAGADILIGGANTAVGDTLSYAGSLTAVRVDLNLATQGQFLAGAVLNGDAALDQTSGFENIIGSAFNDILTGDGLDNVINGGLGNDILTGGLGADSFIFNSALNALTNRDTANGFESGIDRIHLDNAIFTAVGINGALAAGAFALSTDIAAADDRIIYNTTTGTLTYDSNGSVAGGQTVFATLTGVPSVTFADFLII